MTPKLQFQWRRAAIITADAAVVISAIILGYLLRFDFNLEALDPEFLKVSLLCRVPAFLIAALGFGLYRGVYYYASFADLQNIIRVVASSGILSAAAILFIRQGQYPRSLLILQPLLAFVGICGVRFFIRFLKTRFREAPFAISDTRRVLIFGAGEIGEGLLRQFQMTTNHTFRVVGLIDDDPTKRGMRLHGYPVLGNRADLEAILEKEGIDEVIIAIAAQRGELVRSVVEICQKSKEHPEVRIAPTLTEMLLSPGAGIALRKVRPADLLNREEVRLDAARIARTLERKVVLVTGAGGTIGSELARQALKYLPEKVVILENHSTSLFYTDRELRGQSRGAAIVPILGDLRDQGLLERVFKEHKPQVVLHAGAHKHVHQLEFNVPEGISNNVVGTFQMCAAAKKHGAEKFILVSTDKAVNPSSVMGATKRGAEVIVQSFAGGNGTAFAGVRFGNVLGSSGSVLKLFSEQIAKGGPVTVTDEKVTRYFMTVEEAVGLILQAASMAKGGEIFVLKMGTPVKIVDLAKNLIAMHGLEVGKDIRIEFTGLKQGEKLDEELVEDPAGLTDSEHPDIMLLGSENRPDPAIEKSILDLEILCRGTDAKAALRKLQELVPTFTPDPQHGLRQPEKS